MRLRFYKTIFLLIVMSVFSLNAYSQVIRLPFRYVQSFIILEVKLEGILPLKLIFDTGAEYNLLFNRSHTDLILDSYLRDIKVLGSDLSREVEAILTDSLNINIEDKLKEKFQFIVLKESNTHLSEVIGERVDGILSAKFLKNKVFEIDYQRLRINIYNSKLSEKKLSKYQVCKINVHKDKPYVYSDLSLSNTDSVYHMNFLLDTGAGLAVLIYKDEQASLQIPDKFIPGKIGSGIGGVVEGYISRSKYLSFCKTKYEDVVSNFQKVSSTYYLQEKKYKQGIIGNQILDHYSIIFNYIDELIYLKRIKGKDHNRYDRSGLSIIAGGYNLDQYIVAHLIPGSPGDQAGIHVGDIISGINGISSEFYNLQKIQGMLSSKKRESVRLSLKRNGKKVKREIILHDIL
ncbi:MAG: aspartyl protease family protein [Saprospiraceae bacterium]|nr:aspartyl protease family protein [Saprospiraceae bacterium]